MLPITCPDQNLRDEIRGKKNTTSSNTHMYIHNHEFMILYLSTTSVMIHGQETSSSCEDD